MKTLTIRNDLIRLITPIVIILGFALVWFYTRGVLNAYDVFWLVLLLAIIIIVTPLGSRKLVATETEKPKYAVFPWLGRIFILQIFLGLTFLGITEVATQTLIVAAPKQSNLFMQTFSYFSFGMGLFPWVLIALIAAAFGFFSYRKNKNAYISSTLFPIFHSGPQEAIGLITNTFAKLATTFAFATTLGFFILYLTSLVNSNRLPIATGFATGTTLIVLIIFGFSFTRMFKRYLKHVMTKRIPFFISLTLLALLFAAVIVLLSAVFYSPGKTVTPGVVKTLFAKNWHVLWLIFAINWWLAWTPVIGAHLARLSRGYSVRNLILGVLLLPVILSAFLWIAHHDGYTIDIPHSWVSATFIIIGFIGLITIITARKHLSILLLSYLPRRDQHKPRDHHFFIRKSWQLTLGVLYIYLPAGISALAIILFLGVLPITLVLLITIIALYKALWKDKTLVE